MRKLVPEELDSETSISGCLGGAGLLSGSSFSRR